MATAAAPGITSYVFDDRHICCYTLGDFKHFVFAMLDVDVPGKIVDFVLKFPANEKIFLHRQLALTNTLVVPGDHILYEPNGQVTEVRRVGSYTSDASTRQVIAFHVGDRSSQSATALCEKLPAAYREQAIFYTDKYAVYTGVIPPARHHAISTLARRTNHVERFNCTLRQRVSRLVRATLSFAKKLANHIGAITYFICHYNLTKCAALPE